MTTTPDPSSPTAFVQLIEYRTDQPAAMRALVERWRTAIGAARTARWYVTAADRDRPGVFVQLVEFPGYEDAMRNSAHPATGEFAAGLRELCGADLVFRNLDVTVARRL